MRPIIPGAFPMKMMIPQLLTEDSVDTHRLSDIRSKNVCTVLSQHFCDDHALGNTMGSLRCDQLFSLWAFPVWKYMGLLSA